MTGKHVEALEKEYQRKVEDLNARMEADKRFDVQDQLYVELRQLNRNYARQSEIAIKQDEKDAEIHRAYELRVKEIRDRQDAALREKAFIAWRANGGTEAEFTKNWASLREKLLNDAVVNALAGQAKEPPLKL